MDQIKTGKLIKDMRIKMGLTQKQLAEQLNVSDKAVSKWECGCGCPDVSLLTALSDIFGTDIRVLLSGEALKNEKEKGDMRKINFFVCKECGNIITASSDADVTCCGSKLTALKPQKAEKSEMLKTEEIGGELYVSSSHEMTKEHYIMFAAFVSDRSVMLYRQYPEWAMQFTMPVYRTGRLMWYCTKHGLMYQELPGNPGE